MNPDPTELQAIQQTLGHEFHDPGLLQLALMHPSASGNQSKPSDDNQRMEFLGDAILQAVISEALYRLHPNKDEGHLTKARAGLVNGTMLAAKAAALGLEQHLVLGRGQRTEFERGRDSALEDALVRGDRTESLREMNSLAATCSACHDRFRN